MSESITAERFGGGGLGRHRAFEEDRVLDDAVRLFWEQGFEATSIEDVSERTGLSRSSIYQAFNSKRGLFDSALERYLDRWIGSLLETLESGRKGLDDVTGFFTGLADGLDDPGVDPELGCFMVNTIAELAWRDDRVSETGESYRDRLRRAFLRALRRARRRRELRPGDLDGRARLLAALTMGVFVTQRGNPNLEDSRHLVRAIVEQVEAWREP